MLRIAVLAGPGIDISSPSALLAGFEGVEALSPGDIIRTHHSEQTPVGQQMMPYLDTGTRFPDEFMIGIIVDSLAKMDRGWVLLNFPRTPMQAQLLARCGYEPDVVIELVISDDETLSRLGWGRTCGDCAARYRRVFFHPPLDSDDCAECGRPREHQLDGERHDGLVKRIAQYRENADSLAAYYQAKGKFLTVSGAGEYDEVAARLKAALPPFAGPG